MLTLIAAAGSVTDACGEEPSTTCRRVFEWTDNEFLADAADFLVARPLQVVLILLVAWFVNRVVRRAIRRFVEHAKDPEWQEKVAQIRRRTGVALLDTGPAVSARRAQRADAIGAVLRSVTTTVIYSLAALIALGELGINLGPLIAGAGIVGVALGFGAQSLVKDFLSGIFMLVEDQYGVGDFVEIDDRVQGMVESISLRATSVRDVNGTVWHIPNGEVRAVGNMSQGWARAVLDVDVAYDTDLGVASDLVKATADAMWNEPEYHNLVIMEEPEVWGIQHLGADGISIRLVVKTRPSQQWATGRELRRRIKDAFDEAGIEIPFPQRTVWVRQEPSDGAPPFPGTAP